MRDKDYELALQIISQAGRTGRGIVDTLNEQDAAEEAARRYQDKRDFEERKFRSSEDRWMESQNAQQKRDADTAANRAEYLKALREPRPKTQEELDLLHARKGYMDALTKKTAGGDNQIDASFEMMNRYHDKDDELARQENEALASGRGGQHGTPTANRLFRRSTSWPSPRCVKSRRMFSTTWAKKLGPRNMSCRLIRCQR